jgi:tRNA (guanine37-N1)-methyltransferase
MRFDILSLFPDYFKGPFDVSMIKRARDSGLIEIGLIDIRAFAEGRHQQVDDRPYGGGPGMVLMPDPVTKAIRSVRKKRSRVIYLSPQGEPLTARKCEKLASEEHLILLCGHYEGVDQRALDLEVDEEISIGDFVVTSGAPAAIVLVDAVSRFIPGVIGNEEAARQDSFENGLFDAPVYTRPPVFEELEVPLVLRQGHHAEIERWRKDVAYRKTKHVRPDLIEELIEKEKQT